MKLNKTTILFCTFINIIFCINKMNAQNKGIIVGVNAFGYKSNLYNKLDANADNRLNYIRTYSSSYGIEVGWKINDKWSVVFNPKKSKVNQNYKGEAVSFYGPYKSSIETKLNYYSIPILINRDFGKRKFKLSSSIGVQFWHLINYTDHMNSTYTNSGSEYNFDRNIANNNLDIYMHAFSPETVKATLDHYMYKKNLLGLNGSIGATYNITNSLQVYSKIFTEYTLFDIENKKDIKATPKKGDSFFQNDIFQPFSLPIKYTNGSDPSITKRENSHIFDLGLMVGVHYLIKQ